MNKKSEKSGQMQISFGMIFSIILIIFFIAFAIYGITKFLDTANFAKFEKFKSDFQADIDSMWNSPSGSQEVEYILPRKIEKVCFTDGEFENMYFVSKENYKGEMLDNVDIAKTVAGLAGRRLCISTLNGEISMTIKKDFGEQLVTIKR
jgi:hypothetical protein